MDELTGLGDSKENNRSRLDWEAADSQFRLNEDTSEPTLDEKVLTQGLHLNDWVQNFEVKKDFVPVIDASTKPKGVIEKLGLTPHIRFSKKIMSKINGQQSLEILRVSNLCQNYSECLRWGWTDTPKPGDRFENSTLAIGGWLVGKINQPIALRFLNRQVLIAETPINIPRPDVIKAHFYDVKFSNCGYHVSLNLQDFSGEVEIDVEAIFADGTKTPACILTLYRYG
jgi:hypothetical protein